MRFAVVLLLLLTAGKFSIAQHRYELNSGWKCQQIGKIKATGEKISQTGFAVFGWLPAMLPGTVLTTLLNNRLVPHPFFGMNNESRQTVARGGDGLVRNLTHQYVAGCSVLPGDQRTILLQYSANANGKNCNWNVIDGIVRNN